MNFEKFLREGERLVTPEDPYLQYEGRIDFDDPEAPVFIYPYTSVKTRFTGTQIKVLLKNLHAYWDNYLGFVIDGVQGKVKIPENGGTVCLTVAEHLPAGEHELFFFKRMDSCHVFAFYGFALDEGAKVLAPERKPVRRMEVFGDSVSAGEVSEAVEYVGKTDPEHNGEYSNSYYSYAAITARKLNAQLHDVAQGGIALFHGIGWYCEQDPVGMEEIWDKMEYAPELGMVKPWDFSRYTPHVVIVAIGQNDSHPFDFMKEAYGGEQAKKWKKHYERFLRTLRRTYPKALIVAMTTLLQHDRRWDDAIGEACAQVGDPGIVHFLYSRNGCGTPGHLRIPEAEEMACELSTFLESYGEKIWKD